MSQFYNSRQLWRRRQVWRQRAQTPTIVREPESDKKDEEVSEETENAVAVAAVLKEETQSFTLFHDIAKEIEEKINEITAKKEERKLTFAPFVSVYRIPSLVDIRAAFDHHESKENENQRLKTIIITSSPPASSSSSLFPNYHQDLYWSPRDYETFKQDAILEIRTFWKLFGKSNSVMKDPATILYQPCNKGSCDEIQNDFIYELITLSKHTNNPQYYSSLSNALTTLFDCPDVKEKLFATPMMNTSFLRHVDTLSRLEDFISEDPVYDITETEKMGGSKVLPYYGDEDDDSEEDDMETVTTKDSMGSLASTPPDRQYPSSLIIGESDPESCSDGSPYSFY